MKAFIWVIESRENGGLEVGFVAEIGNSLEEAIEALDDEAKSVIKFKAPRFTKEFPIGTTEEQARASLAEMMRGIAALAVDMSAQIVTMSPNLKN